MFQEGGGRSRQGRHYREKRTWIVGWAGQGQSCFPGWCFLSLWDLWVKSSFACCFPRPTVPQLLPYKECSFISLFFTQNGPPRYGWMPLRLFRDDPAFLIQKKRCQWIATLWTSRDGAIPCTLTPFVARLQLWELYAISPEVVIAASCFVHLHANSSK